VSATLLDEPQYRKLLDAALPVGIRTEEEYLRLLGTLAALMDIPEGEMSEEEGRLLELLSIVIDEFETRAHPLPERQTAQDACLYSPRENHETELPLDRAAEEPCIGSPEAQAKRLAEFPSRARFDSPHQTNFTDLVVGRFGRGPATLDGEAALLRLIAGPSLVLPRLCKKGRSRDWPRSAP
jgi:hypothetical protein